MVKDTQLRYTLFMKVGPHSGLSLEEIIAIKREEEKKYGRFFWGYAGTLCHPFKVRAFAEHAVKSGNIPMMVMLFTSSKYFGSGQRQKEFSKDNIRWEPLPDGVVLTGCKYALIGKTLRPYQVDLDLNSYVVWNGNQLRLWTNCDKTLGHYLRGQVNKACAVLSSTSKGAPRPVKVIYVADIVEPYCVFVR